MKLIGFYKFNTLVIINIVNLKPPEDQSTRYAFKPVYAQDFITRAIQSAGDRFLQFAMTKHSIAGDPWGVHVLIPKDHKQYWYNAAKELPESLEISQAVPVADLYGGLHCPEIELVAGKEGHYWIEL